MADKAEQVGREEGMKKIGELIKDAKIAMLITTTAEGWMRSRPMGTNRNSFDGNIWFFTHASEPKVQEIQQHPQVNVSFSNPDDNEYVSLSGRASLVHDRQKMEELWQKPLETWFPKGLDDPDLALLKVDVEHAEYWDQNAGLVEVAAGFVKAKVTGEESDAGYGTKVELNQGT
jgi:general stress protein 26